MAGPALAAHPVGWGLEASRFQEGARLGWRPQGSPSLLGLREHRNAQGPAAAQALSFLLPGPGPWAPPSTPPAPETSRTHRSASQALGPQQITAAPLQGCRVQLTHGRPSQRAAARTPSHTLHRPKRSHTRPGAPRTHVPPPDSGVAFLSTAGSRFPHFWPPFLFRECPGWGCHRCQPCWTPQHQCSRVHAPGRPTRCPPSPCPWMTARAPAQAPVGTSALTIHHILAVMS